MSVVYLFYIIYLFIDLYLVIYLFRSFTHTYSYDRSALIICSRRKLAKCNISVVVSVFLFCKHVNTLSFSSVFQYFNCYMKYMQKR